jgi:hypothetical protein
MTPEIDVQEGRPQASRRGGDGGSVARPRVGLGHPLIDQAHDIGGCRWIDMVTIDEAAVDSDRQ